MKLRIHPREAAESLTLKDGTDTGQTQLQRDWITSFCGDEIPCVPRDVPGCPDVPPLSKLYTATFSQVPPASGTPPHPQPRARKYPILQDSGPATPMSLISGDGQSEGKPPPMRHILLESNEAAISYHNSPVQRGELSRRLGNLSRR